MADDIRKPARPVIDIGNFDDPVNKQFWTLQSSPKGGIFGRPPKAQFRYKVVVPGLALQDSRTGEEAADGTAATRGGSDKFDDEKDGEGGLVWYAKSVDKPGIDIPDDTKDHYQTFGVKALPRPRVTSPTYKPINMIIVDPYYPNATRKVARMFRRGGLNDQKARDAINPNGTLTDFSDSFLETVGEVVIYQLDEKGNPIEKWTLYGAYPDKVDFGKLDYSSDDLVEISLTFYYSRFSVEFPKIGDEQPFTYFPDKFDETTPKPPTAKQALKLCEEAYNQYYAGSTADRTIDEFIADGDCESLGVPAAGGDPENREDERDGAAAD